LIAKLRELTGEYLLCGGRLCLHELGFAELF
jgi:hypothetical protein